MSKKSPMLIRNVPESTRKEFRLSCLQNNVTMREVLVEVMNYLTDPQRLRNFLEVENGKKESTACAE